MIKSLILSIALLLSIFCSGQLNTYAPEELDSLLSLKNKKTLLIISAEWCRFCEMMKNSTLTDSEVIELLNNDFYFVSLDESHQKDLKYSNKIYTYLNLGESNSKHELALTLGKINDEYILPATCVFDENSDLIFQYSGYLSNEELIKLLTSLN